MSSLHWSNVCIGLWGIPLTSGLAGRGPSPDSGTASGQG